MFERINHVGIAVSELDPAIAQYRARFGCELVERELLEDGAVEAALLRTGESCVELVAPLGADTSLARFIAERGPSLHHVAYEVDDIDAALASLREQEVTMIDDVPRPGIHGSRIAFVHPSSCMGVLTEIVELAR